MVEGGVSNRAEPAPGGGGSHPHLRANFVYMARPFRSHLRSHVFCRYRGGYFKSTLSGTLAIA